MYVYLLSKQFTTRSSKCWENTTMAPDLKIQFKAKGSNISIYTSFVFQKDFSAGKTVHGLRFFSASGNTGRSRLADSTEDTPSKYFSSKLYFKIYLLQSFQLLVQNLTLQNCFKTEHAHKIASKRMLRWSLVQDTARQQPCMNFVIKLNAVTNCFRTLHRRTNLIRNTDKCPATNINITTAVSCIAKRQYHM